MLTYFGPPTFESIQRILGGNCILKSLDQEVDEIEQAYRRRIEEKAILLIQKQSINHILKKLREDKEIVSLTVHSISHRSMYHFATSPLTP